MKYIEVDEELYRFIAGKTERIGESASDILRRLLGLAVENKENSKPESIHEPSLEAQRTEEKPKEVKKNVKSESIEFAHLFNDEALQSQKGAVGRFLFVLGCLYKSTPENFAQVLQVQGRGRLYFATSKEALLEASKSANPKEIGTSGYWVTTNNNTAKKQTILNEVLHLLGCEVELAAELSAKI
ncbi:replication initiation negative regulator SeqA [Shewanella sp. OPT22]|nr:replication initiation negative regulator SeqA [Shewanella sp. OPT22]